MQGVGRAVFGVVLVAALSPAKAATESVLYAFKGGSDGELPQGALIDLNGVLYGTTTGGGAAANGTIFSLTLGGTEKILHSFTDGADGSSPNGSLVNVNGTLYGTTYFGGASEYSSGTVFSITPSGVETVLHSFQGNGDGANPVGGLVDVSGVLYGTTFGGGTNGQGTVFRITTGGAEKVVYSFQGGSDGAHPFGATLIYALGKLYGGTAEGGNGCAGGCGALFSVTKQGAEKVLYAFKGGSDGQQPNGLIFVGGDFYGTTTDGGGVCGFGNPPQLPCGTVFKVTPAGSEKVLYVFGQHGSDGYEPFMSSLLQVNKTLWGVCANGFVNGETEGGSVFSVTKAGVEHLVHAFNTQGDGAYPEGTLINVGGILYGTTMNGGTANNTGTVFTLTP